MKRTNNVKSHGKLVEILWRRSFWYIQTDGVICAKTRIMWTLTNLFTQLFSTRAAT